MKKVESREHSPSQPADRRALAEINDLIEDGVYEAAGVLAWDVQRETPGDPAIWLILTRIDYLRERYAAAMYAARMATRLDPSSAEAWLWLARSGVTRARWRTEALDAALQATALGPHDPQTWTVLAELHLAHEARYEAAIAAERAIRVGPNDVAAHRILGEIALQANEWSHAAAAFRKTLELDADDERARDGLAEALREQGIDPADELARYGATPLRQRGMGGRFRKVARDNLDLSDPGPLRARPRGLLIGLAACLILGALVGLVLPALGLVRGLVGAAALALMWVAIWPMQRTQPVPAKAHAARARQADGDRPPSARRDVAPSTRGEQRAAASTPKAPRADQAPRPKRQSQPASTPWDEKAAATHAEPEVAQPAEPDEPARARAMRARADRSRLDRMTRGAGERGTATSKRPPPDDADDQRAAPEAGNGAGDGWESSTRLPRGDHDQPQHAADDNRKAAAEEHPAPADEHAAPEADEETPAQTGDAAPAGEPAPAEGAADDLPSDMDELVALSSTRLAEFDLEAAREAAERLAEVAPDSLESHRALGAVSLAAQDYAQAEVHYGKVLEIEPLDQEAHERLAMAKKGRRREEQPQRHRRRKG